MIQPNELRFDNIIEISGIQQTVNKSVFQALIQNDFKKIKGIPITAEWLRSFDAEFDQGAWYYLNMDEEQCIGIRMIDATHIFCVEIQKDEPYPGSVIKVDIKYVHQLQNLYFALTGEELTLKEIQSEHSN